MRFLPLSHGATSRAAGHSAELDVEEPQISTRVQLGRSRGRRSTPLPGARAPRVRSRPDPPRHAVPLPQAEVACDCWRAGANPRRPLVARPKERYLLQMLVICQISDLHFRDAPKDNPARGRGAGLAQTLLAHSERSLPILIAVTGDVAYSGRAEEYREAVAFFETLLGGLATTREVALAVVPGNHDCDFTAPGGRVRDAILNGLRSETIDHEHVEKCTEVQAAFHQAFVRPLASGFTVFGCTGLVQRFAWTPQACTVGIQLVNSAWMSKKQESLATIHLPEQLIRQATPWATEPSVVVSLHHHPEHWHSGESRRAFRQFLTDSADVVLSGHEHTPAGSIVTSMPLGRLHVFEGDLFQDPSVPKNSGFSLVSLSDTTHKLTRQTFAWRGGFYQEQRCDTHEYRANGGRARAGPALGQSFRDSLNDPGVRFSHPRKAQLGLDDIFVEPRLQEIRPPNPDQADNPKLGEVNARQVTGSELTGYLAEFFPKNPRVFVVGAEQSGKSTLAKRTFQRLIAQGLWPILVPGSRLAAKVSTVARLLESLIQEQYEGPVDQFLALPTQARVLIVDGYESIPGTPVARGEKVAALMDQFGATLLLGQQDARLAELTDSSGGACLLFGFQHLFLLEFGRTTRGDLVERWLAVGSPEWNEQEWTSRLRVSERVLNQCIGKGLIPPKPLYILATLQQLETRERLDTGHGSHGFVYEALLTNSLADAGVAGADMPTYYSYLAALAGRLDGEEGNEVTESEFMRWHLAHCDSLLLDLRYEETRRVLERAGVLDVSSGVIRFRYRYAFYYFYAHHIAENLDAHHGEVRRMCGALYEERSANVLLFLTFLSSSEFILRAALEAAQNLYATTPEWRPDGYPDALSGYTPRDLAVDTGRLSQNRREYREAGDSADRQREWIEAAAQEDLTREEFQGIMTMNAAFKSVEILGQMLRNFRGRLSADQKVELAGACVSLSLRMLGYVFELLEAKREQIATSLVRAVRHLDGAATMIPGRAEAEAGRGLKDLQRANAWAHALLEGVVVGVLLHNVESIGSGDLFRLYRRVLTSRVEHQLLLLGLELEHGHEFPEGHALGLFGNGRDDRFVSAVTRRIVYRHFLLFPVEPRLRQSLCARLQIHVTPQLVGGSHRRTR